jgi:hypothetical protein
MSAICTLLAEIIGEWASQYSKIKDEKLCYAEYLNINAGNLKDFGVSLVYDIVMTLCLHSLIKPCHGYCYSH